MAHALAVQRAIQGAQRDNQAFLQREALASLHASTHTGIATVKSVAPTPTGVTHTVSKEDVVLGLRIGEKLMLVDKQDNKVGTFVTAVDALITKARTALGAETGSSMQTTIGGTASTLTIVRGQGNGGAIQMYFQESPTAPRQAVDAIGKLDWRL